ncbi:hypothetical protein N7474_008334 [Penicillium riverlandense]|uniref:uncharacterized protein n=1 Tax=Penicillium riverlandense TaxID=1903569 RepID=UPI0025483DA0|nr:uncharacterized protein N7474_008334 [Penicillium riverlandense]KAJ5812033.1 hypothetical protein N7474_008334 [Penicillium riverlandense]
MPFAQALLSDEAIPVAARQQALDRIFSDPGIPCSTTTSSFWLQEPHPRFTQRALTTTTLPSVSDVVIIGSGITGVSIARTLLQCRAHESSVPTHPAVVMLEARGICSGATGRNGGHILETADEYAELADVFGEDVARKTLRFRLSHLKEMLRVADEFGLTEEAQARKVQFLSVFFEDDSFKEALDRLQKFREGLPEESAEWTAYEAGAIPKEFNLSRARGVIAGPAGALWPYKFVTGVLSRLLEEYPQDFLVEEHTAVTAIHNTSSTKELRYKVETSRGTIFANHVIHCTNAHVSHLVPGLRGRIFPVRGQMSAQTPGDRFPCQAKEHSWLFNYERGFDYLTQLPGGQMMLGGGFAQGEGGGLADLGIATDSDLSLYIDIHLSGALSAIFGRQAWGRVNGDPVQAMWTGNMAFSSDGFPWVGRLPASMTRRDSDRSASASSHGNGAEWVCAAFGGEGMVQAWLCGKALATMLLLQDRRLAPTADADMSWFPDQMLVSEERIAAAELPNSVADNRRQANL